MALPVIQKTWTFSVSNRITWVSTSDAVNRSLFGLKNFLKTNGYTVKGSSNGTTAAMDGVDRWSVLADASVRGANATTAQSWIVLQDANTVDILLANQGGAGGSTAIFGMSPGQNFVAAGTATFQPTATDAVIPSTSFGIGNTTGFDFIWNGWVDSTKKLFRWNVAQNGSFVGQHIGVELVDSCIAGTTAVFSPAVWIFSTRSNQIPNGTSIGLARVLSGSVPNQPNTTQLCFFGMEWFGFTSLAFTTLQPPLQGGNAYGMWPLGLGMQANGDGLGHAANFNGKLCRLFDWWAARSDAPYGSTYGSKTFIAVDGVQGAFTAGGAWPWDGTTTPVLT